MKSIFIAAILFIGMHAQAQNVGINTSTPQAALDVQGDMILRNADITLVNGANEDINTSTTKSSHYSIIGPSSVFEVGGLTGGIDGRIVSLYNSSAYLMTIKHLSAGSVAVNQINTGTGVDFVLSSYSAVTFRYQTLDNLWHVLSSHNVWNTGTTTNLWAASGNNISSTNSGNVGIGTSTALQKLDVVGASILANATIIDPDLYDNRVVAGRIADGSGFDVISGIGGNASTNPLFQGRSWALGSNGNNFYIGAGTSIPNTIQTGIQINANRNVVLVPISGNVGVAYSNPSATFDVGRGTGTGGTAAFRGTTHVTHINFGTTEDTYIRGGKTGASVILNDSHNGNVYIAEGGGNVGIGTNVLAYKLNVNGSVRSKEVVVETGWADYVFDKKYKRLPLAEVEKYIAENNHLPNVPSAEEIQTNGLKVGEMQTKMMEKIEELTLYVIELKKEIELLKTKNNLK